MTESDLVYLTESNNVLYRSLPVVALSRARTQRGWCGYVARRKMSRFFHVNSFELVTNVLLSLSSAHRFQISEQWTNFWLFYLEQRGKSCQDTVSIRASSTVSCVSQIHHMNSNKFLFLPVIFRGSSTMHLKTSQDFFLRYTSFCRITRLLLVGRRSKRKRKENDGELWIEIAKSAFT